MTEKGLFSCREHRDELMSLVIYIILFIVLIFIAISYKLDILSLLLIIIIILPLILNAFNSLNRPCPSSE